MHVRAADVQQSPTKRRALFGAVAAATVAIATRKKSSNASATAAESADQRQPSALLADRPMTAGLGVCKVWLS